MPVASFSQPFLRKSLQNRPALFYCQPASSHDHLSRYVLSTIHDGCCLNDDRCAEYLGSIGRSNSPSESVQIIQLCNIYCFEYYSEPEILGHLENLKPPYLTDLIVYRFSSIYSILRYLRTRYGNHLKELFVAFNGIAEEPPCASATRAYVIAHHMSALEFENVSRNFDPRSRDRYIVYRST